ncbi:hypothetical protein M3906_003371 [Vibrio metschnikovii]|nr:hypothetical protein [Vibrio metschnikovii]
MIPSKKQWKNWTLPSKYSVLGFPVSIMSLVVGVIGCALALIPLLMVNNSSEQHFITQLHTAQQELRDTVLTRQKYHFSPDFYSQEGAISTLEVLNDYVSEMSRVVDSGTIHRLVKEHGSAELKSEHNKKINVLHNRAKELSYFLVEVINSDGPKDDGELKLLNANYVEKLNLMLEAESEYQSFIGNLLPSNFSS